MSEAELHILRSRLRGGILSKARRGELKTPLPIGLVYDPAGKVTLDPDSAVRDAVAQLFEIFQRTGATRATVKEFAERKLSFPQRIHAGERKGELVWSALTHDRVLHVLHNPRYAGAFCYGRRQAKHLDPRRQAQPRARPPRAVDRADPRRPPRLPTNCASSTSNAPATTPSSHAAATSPSTPTTDSSPTPSKPTGTTSSANSSTSKTSTTEPIRTATAA